MTYKFAFASLLALAAVQSLPAQNLTARQLFYKEEPDAKPAPARPVVKTQPKKSPSKTGPKTAPSQVATPAPEAALVQNAVYTEERPLGLRYALVRVADDGAESEVSSAA